LLSSEELILEYIALKLFDTDKFDFRFDF